MLYRNTRTFATNALFGTFFLSTFGCGLLQAWAVEFRAGSFVYALIAVPGIVLCGLVLYRYSKHWPAGQTARPDGDEKSHRLIDYSSLIWYPLLGVTGAGMALLASGGPFFFLSIAASGMVCMPWTRIPACRNHFFISSAALLVGAFIGLAMSGKLLHPLDYVLSGWILLLTSCLMALFIVMTHRNRFDRMPASGY